MAGKNVEFYKPPTYSVSARIEVGLREMEVTASRQGRGLGRRETVVSRSGDTRHFYPFTDREGPVTTSLTDEGDYTIVRTWTLKGAIKKGAEKFAERLRTQERIEAGEMKKPVDTVK